MEGQTAVDEGREDDIFPVCCLLFADDVSVYAQVGGWPVRFVIFIVEDPEKAAKDVSSSLLIVSLSLFIAEDPEKAAKDVSSSMFIAVDTGTGAKDVQSFVFKHCTSGEFLGAGLDIFSLVHR